MRLMRRLLGAVLSATLAAQPAFAGGMRSAPAPTVRTGGIVVGVPSLPNVSIPSVGSIARIGGTAQLSTYPLQRGFGDKSAAVVDPAAASPILSASRPAPLAQSPGARAPLAPVPVAERLQALEASVAADHRALPNLGGEASRGAADAQFARLTGGFEHKGSGDAPLAPLSGVDVPSEASLAPAGDSKPPKKPEPPGVREIMRAVPVFKLGAEAASLAIPIIALQTAGAAGVASVVIAYQVSQALGSWLAAGLASRWRASAVASGALAAQGAAIAGVLVLSAAGAFSFWMLLPTYALVGATIGMIDTARKSIPALLVGQDQQALRTFNARMHQRYQVAGVAGAFAIAGLMAWVGPLWALALQPATFAYAAYLFWKVKHAKAEGGAAGKGPIEGLKNWAREMKDGLLILVRDPRLRWVTFAMILPLVVHRVFEDLFMPVYAKGVLGAAALVGVLRAISNLGEYGGATALLKWSGKRPGAAVWVKWGGAGMAAAWALSLAAGLPLALSLVLLVPAIFVFSATWAASHLSLESDVQERLPVQDQPHVMAVLNGLNIATTAAATYALGRLFEKAGPSGGFLTIEIGLTLLGVAILYAAARLKKTDRR